MKRQTYSAEERIKYRQEAVQRKKLDEANHKVLNQQFRKSGFYISSLAIRILYVCMVVVVLLFHDKQGSSESEVVISKDFENYTSVSKYGSAKNTKTLYVETDKGNYEFNVTGTYLPPFEINDTLIIERNIFGKPIYFTKADWDFKYDMPLHYLYYCIILMFTLFSFFLNDGPSKFVNGILVLAMALNITGILGYFLF